MDTTHVPKNRKKVLGILCVSLLVLCVAGVAWFIVRPFTKTTTVSAVVTSFKDCMDAGNPVMERYPRVCTTANGTTYTEEIPGTITYTNTTSNTILHALPVPGSHTGKEIILTGKARGSWYFEASFPVEILDTSGKTLSVGYAQAQGEWMTNEFVPYISTIKIPVTYTGAVTVLLKKDNPSGMKENDASISFPIIVK